MLSAPNARVSPLQTVESESGAIDGVQWVSPARQKVLNPVEAVADFSQIESESTSIDLNTTANKNETIDFDAADALQYPETLTSSLDIAKVRRSYSRPVDSATVDLHSLRAWYADLEADQYYRNHVTAWGSMPSSDDELVRWSHFSAVQDAYFADHEERRGLSISETGALNGLTVLRTVLVLPSLLYAVGIAAYFYVGMVPNCFIGLERIENYTGSRHDWHWTDGTEFNASNVPWSTPATGAKTKSYVAALIGRSYGYTHGIDDIGGLSSNQFPGQPFRPLCRNTTENTFFLLPYLTTAMTSKTAIDRFKESRLACRVAGAELASLHDPDDFSAAREICVNSAPNLSILRSYYPSGVVVGHVAIATLWVHYWAAIQCRRVLAGDTRLNRLERWQKRYILVSNDMTGKTVIPRNDWVLVGHFNMVFISVILHIKGLSGAHFLTPAIMSMLALFIFKRLESHILDAQYAHFENYQLKAGKRWLACSLALLVLWIWIAIEQPLNGYAGTWRRTFLVCIGQQYIVLTTFVEWVLDSKSCDPANLHWTQAMAALAMLFALVVRIVPKSFRQARSD
jgi:hypothetical protein